MQLTAGYPFWLIKDGLRYHYPKLKADAIVHAVIIGGGISGALNAYYLTKAGIECILVDRRTIGLGSTCASTSLLQYELDISLNQLIEKVGKNTAIRIYKLCENSIRKIKELTKDIHYTEYEERGSLFFSTHLSEESFMMKEYEARKKAGLDVSILSEQEMKNKYGLVAAYGILSETGATINAYSLTHKILQHCQHGGLKVFDRTKITGIDYYSGYMELKTDEGYFIKTRNIVNATGFEVISFLKKDIVDFYCTYAISSENMQEEEAIWKDRILMWSTDDPYIYMRLTEDNRIIVGGRDERFSNRITRETYLQKKSKLLQQDFMKLFPGIKFKNEFTWSGTFGKTKDSLPYIGEYPPGSNTYYALGFGGNGITFSVIGAEIIKDLILGQKNEDVKLFSFER
jgi:glycine/D-amino acid oxidase-like deaminating enzyme